jgi:hypothetical protein
MPEVSLVVGSARVQSSRATFRSAWWNASLGILVSIGVLVAVSGTAHSGLWGGSVWGAIALGCAVLAIRVFRACVIVDEQGVTVRGFIRTRRLDWTEIAAVRAESSGNVTGAGRCVVFTLEDGRRILARGVSGYTDRITRIATEIAALRPG